MENNLKIHLHLDTIPYNLYTLLRKNDYIKIESYMRDMAKKCFSLSELPDTSIEINNTSSSTSYTLKEFKEHFSNSEKFNNLSIHVFIPKSSSYIAFLVNKIVKVNISVCINSNQHTQAELEDILEELLTFIKSLIASHQQNILMTESMPQNYGNNFENNTITNSGNPASQKIKFYKSGIFWAASGVIVTIVIGILQIIT